MQIDFLMDSASRPDILKLTMESIFKHLKSSMKINWMFHEAVIRKEDSEQCLDYAKNLNLFDVIETTDPPLGEGYSISKMLRRTKTNFFLHWEDDHPLVRDLDLDKCYRLLEEYDNINQLGFWKRTIDPSNCGWPGNHPTQNYIFGNDKLCVMPHWRFSPAIWRLSWIKPRWIWYDERPGGSSVNFEWEANGLLQKEYSSNKTPEIVAKDTGTFYFGSIGDEPYTEHIGAGRSGRIEGK